MSRYQYQMQPYSQSNNKCECCATHCMPMQLVSYVLLDALSNQCNSQRCGGTQECRDNICGLASWGVGLYSDSSFDRLSVTSMLTALPGPASLVMGAI